MSSFHILYAKSTLLLLTETLCVPYLFLTVQVMASGSSDAVIEEFMAENARRADANFGAQADNATAVACYIIMSSQT